jgi:Tfp pilus assembly protein PilO
VNGRQAWWRLWYVWLIPALIVLLNAFWLLGLRGVVLGRGSLLAKQKAQVEADVGKLKVQVDALARTQEGLAALQENLGALRQRQLGSMRGRLVRFLLDVVRRAEAAGLKPERITYQAKPEKKSKLTHFSAQYALDGTYEQVRECVKLLESSPQFVIVEHLALRGDEQASSLEIGLQLSVATYFSDVDEAFLKSLGITQAIPAQADESAGLDPPELAAAPLSSGRIDLDSADRSLARLTRQVNQQLNNLPPTPVPERPFALPPRGSKPVATPAPPEPDDEFLAGFSGQEVSGGR